MGSNEFDIAEAITRSRQEQNTNPDKERVLEPEIAHRRTQENIVNSILFPPFDAVHAYRVRP